MEVEHPALLVALSECQEMRVNCGSYHRRNDESPTSTADAPQRKAAVARWDILFINVCARCRFQLKT